MGGTWTTVVPLALVGAGLVAWLRPAYLREDAPGLALPQRLGLALIAAPLFALLLVGITSLPGLLEARELAPLSPDRLTAKALVHLGLYLILPVVGLGLVLGPRGTLAAIKRGLLGPRDGSHPMAKSLALASLLSAGLIALVSLAWALPLAPGQPFSAGGASQFFAQTTPGVALLLAGAAALAEETLFRGLLLSHLRRLSTTRVAVAGQAVLFGLIHAGYGSIEHVVAAGIFGYMMAHVTLRWGLLPAIVTHFLVNVAVLSLWSGHTSLFTPVAVAVLVLLLAAWLLAPRDHGQGTDTSTPSA